MKPLRFQAVLLLFLALGVKPGTTFAQEKAPSTASVSGKLTPPPSKPSSKAPVIDEATKKAVRDSFNLKSRQALGGWTGSGGDGLVCFASKEIAQQALDASGRLRKHARSQILDVTITDKTLGFQDALRAPKTGDTITSYLEEQIRLNIEPGSPYLAMKFRLAIATLLDSTGKPRWTPQDGLPKLDDAGATRELWLKKGNFENCRLIQIAIRYQKSVSNETPLVFVDYDQDLYERLGQGNPLEKIQQQATLILHEALYLIEVDAGAVNSEAVRNIYYLIFSQNTRKLIEIQDPSGRYSSLLKSFCFYGFDKFWWAFVDKNATPLEGTATSRRFSKAEMEDKRKEIRNQLFNAKEIKYNRELLLTSEERDQVLLRLFPYLTREQVFLFVSESYFEAGESKTHPDIFLLNDSKESFSIAATCSRIHQDYQRIQLDFAEGKGSFWETALKSAGAYCDSL